MSRGIGFLLFLIMLFIANMLLASIENPSYHQIVQFLNTNIGLIILFSLIFFVAELFDFFIFPFNLPAPLINAVGILFLLKFVYNSFGLVEALTQTQVFQIFRQLSSPIYLIVFLAVLIGGYISIFIRLARKEEPRKRKLRLKKPKTKPTWQDVGDEFRGMIYDAFREVRESIKSKKK